MFSQKFVSEPDGGYHYEPAENKLDFISVGVCMSDPGDIEYRYVIECGDRSAGHIRNGKSCPMVKCFRVSDKHGEKFREKPMSKWTLTEEEIPEPEAEIA